MSTLGDNVQSLGYLSYTDVYDLNISPDFLSGPGSSLFKNSSHAWSAAVMSSSRFISSHGALVCRAASYPREERKL